MTRSRRTARQAGTPEVWVDHDLPPLPRNYEKCPKCGDDLVLRHHCRTVPPVEFFVPGRPIAQGSKRHVGRGVLIESARDLGPWRERVALAAHNAAQYCDTDTLQTLYNGPVDVRLDFVMPRPKSAPKTRTPAATKRPDIDKLIRAALDALTGVIFADDAQVTHLHATKRLADIAETPGVHVTVDDVLSLMHGQRYGHRRDT